MPVDVPQSYKLPMLLRYMLSRLPSDTQWQSYLSLTSYNCVPRTSSHVILKGLCMINALPSILQMMKTDSERLKVLFESRIWLEEPGLALRSDQICLTPEYVLFTICQWLWKLNALRVQERKWSYLLGKGSLVSNLYLFPVVWWAEFLLSSLETMK